MKPTKEEVRGQFRQIVEDRLAAFDAKHFPPKPPTLKEIRNDLHRGRARLSVPCGCKLNSRVRYDYRAPELDDILGQAIIYPAAIDVFLKAARRFHAKRSQFKTTLEAVSREAQNDVLYGKANFSAALDKLRAVTVRQKRRE